MAETISPVRPEQLRQSPDTHLRAGLRVTERARSQTTEKQTGVLDRLLPKSAKLKLAQLALAATVLVNAGCGNISAPEIRVPQLPFFGTEQTVEPTKAPYTPTVEATATPTAQPTKTAEPPTATPTKEPTKPPTPTATPEKKIPTELPKDIISKEDLENKYGVKIFNTPDVEMMIREGAIENDPIFQWLQFKDEPTRKHREYLKESNTTDDYDVAQIFWQNPRHLNVFLVNGPVVHPKFFSEEMKAAMDPGLLSGIQNDITRQEMKIRQDFVTGQPQMKKGYEMIMTRLEEEKKSGKISEEEFNATKEAYDDMLRPYIEGPTDQDVYKRLTHASGLFSYPLPERVTKPDGQKAQELKANVFIAVGESNEPAYKERRLSATRIMLEPNGPSSIPIRSQHSYLDPEDFRIDNGDQVYPLKSKNYNKTGSIGTTARHEFFHMISGHPDTDKLVFESIQKAAEAFKNGSDKLYYFVFKKKGKDGKPDEILVTQKEKSEDSSSPIAA